MSRFTHTNDYKDGDTELALGNIVTIQDGAYNTRWVIAGFDMEYNQTSADDNRYDNGLGICLIPQTYLTTGKWNGSDTSVGGYMLSYMHTTVLPGIATNLQNVLGTHIVQRNVLLSSGVIENNSYVYTWTTAYATLMSVGQMTGTFAANNIKYDDGEANYKLPVFNFMEYKNGCSFWLRGVHSKTSAWCVDQGGGITGWPSSYALCVRPLIYIR